MGRHRCRHVGRGPAVRGRALRRDRGHDELAIERRTSERGFDDRDSCLGYLDVQASDRLRGMPLVQPAESFERRAAVTPGAVRETLAEGLQTALLIPGGDPFDAPGWHRYPAYSSHTVHGRAFKPAGRHLPGRGPKERLLVGDDGVSIRLPDGAITVAWSSAVAVAHETPTARQLFARDGFVIPVLAEAWRDGAAAIAAIDAMAPAGA